MCVEGKGIRRGVARPDCFDCFVPLYWMVPLADTVSDVAQPSAWGRRGGGCSLA